MTSTSYSVYYTARVALETYAGLNSGCDYLIPRGDARTQPIREVW